MFEGVTNWEDWVEEHATTLEKMRRAMASTHASALPEGDAEATLDASGIGPEYVRSFDNTTGMGHDNDCGQAAIATMVAHWNLPVHTHIARTERDPRNDRMYPRNDPFVDAVWRDYPTDAGVNWWTWKEQIAHGLRGYGMKNVGIGHSAALGNGQEEWNHVTNWLKTGFPVVVLVDFGPLTGHHYSLHWTILHHYDGSHVHLTNMGGLEKLEWGRFMGSWWCRGVPYENNFVHITGQPR